MQWRHTNFPEFSGTVSHPSLYTGRSLSLCSRLPAPPHPPHRILKWSLHLGTQTPRGLLSWSWSALRQDQGTLPHCASSVRPDGSLATHWIKTWTWRLAEPPFSRSIKQSRLEGAAGWGQAPSEVLEDANTLKARRPTEPINRHSWRSGRFPGHKGQISRAPVFAGCENRPVRRSFLQVLTEQRITEGSG